MSIKKSTLIVALGALGSMGFIASATANTCPSTLERDHHGYWYSNDKPGWKSHRTTKDGVTLKSEHFGGVVYSPERHRLACVYKASNGKWVALVSTVHHGVTIDKTAKDKTGNEPAWKYSTKHKDYACGQPTVTSLAGCPFKLKDQ